jgi:2,4-didehydro-3-deoxy-L-rhamnonate hydrolase
LSPLARVGKFVAIGLNYVDHAEEARLPRPTEPIVFLKANSALCGPDDDTIMPPGASKLDWEVELGIVIGSRTRNVSVERALAHVAGYCVVNDVSERSWQMERGGTWDKGKGYDGFGPVGPYLVTADEVPDPQRLGLWLNVNGERMQQGSTASMIFGCAALVSYVSSFMTLEPGDLIATGTPAGVGMGKTPPRFLSAGDVVTLGIDGLGQQRQLIVADASASVWYEEWSVRDIEGFSLHARRKFHELWANHGSALGAQTLKFFSKLYEVERVVQALEPNERKAIQQERSRPIADALT